MYKSSVSVQSDSNKITAVKHRRFVLPLTYIICTTRLKFFGHTAHADPSVDHSRALRSRVAFCQGIGTTDQANRDKLGFRTVESDVAPLNIGLASSVYHRAQNRQAWRAVVGTATSSGRKTHLIAWNGIDEMFDFETRSNDSEQQTAAVVHLQQSIHHLHDQLQLYTVRAILF